MGGLDGAPCSGKLDPAYPTFTNCGRGDRVEAWYQMRMGVSTYTSSVVDDEGWILVHRCFDLVNEH